MHRSGTSCLAGSLERCGLYLGEVRRTGRFNAKGYYELKSVERLHDQILGSNQASWHHPPQHVQVHPDHRQALEEVAGQLSRRRPCGLKDPRLLMVLETWLKLTPPPLALVGTFRHPVAVAQSLFRRNGLLEEEAIDLWLQYNTMLIRWHQAKAFPIVEYNLSDVEVYCGAVAALALELGLTPNLSQLRRFVSLELEHHRFADAPVPPSCREVYAYLQQHRFQPQISDTMLHLSNGGRARLHGAVREASFFATHTMPAWLARRGRQLVLKMAKRSSLR